jgi:hypothetical protein
MAIHIFPPIPSETLTQLKAVVARGYAKNGAMIRCQLRPENDRMFLLECYFKYYGYEGANIPRLIEMRSGCVTRQNAYLNYLKKLFSNAETV